jgi:hypothetical protein
MDPEIPDHDAARSLVIFSAKRPRQIEIWKSCRPSRILSIVGVNERKAAKPVTHFILVFDLQILPTRIWNFDGPGPPRQILRLVTELSKSFGTIQKNQSKSRTIISGRVLPWYLPNGTALQRISVTRLQFRWFSPQKTTTRTLRLTRIRRKIPGEVISNLPIEISVFERALLLLVAQQNDETMPRHD